MQYVILNSDKTPIDKLRDGGRPWKEVKDFENVGMMVEEPFVVFDFDTTADAEIMLKIVEDLDIKCRVMKTTRGYHFIFKSETPMKNSIKTRCAIGLYYDVKSWGKLTYTVIKKDGKFREWLRIPKVEEMSYVPVWLKPLYTNKFKFRGMSDGDGRNQKLFEYILVMQKKGYSREDIKTTINIINDFVFAEPLSKNELSMILRDESFKDEEELILSGQYFDDEGKFKFNVFGDALMKDMSIVTIGETMYIYKDGYYKNATVDVERAILEVYPGCKAANRMEVIKYIKIKTNIDRDDIVTPEYVVNLQNGRLNLRTGELLEFTPEVIDFCRVPVTYDPAAYDKSLDKMLDKVFCYDKEVRDLFEEMVGYLLLKSSRYRKGFLLYGDGSNGKSTILNMLKAFLGESNYSSVELEKLSDPFKTAELYGKLANIGDDINASDIKDTGTLKKLFTGESVTVERKYEQPFTLKSYAKLIFSCNSIPRIADKTYGMYSRLVLIPFNAIFTADDDDFDPFIEEKVTSPRALSYLLNMGIKGLQRLFKNNRFTEPKVSKLALEAYQTDNSNVLMWIDDEGISTDYLLSNFTDKLFSDFNDWCSRVFVKPSSLRTFHKDIESKYQMERKRVRNNETGGKYKWQFVVKLD